MARGRLLLRRRSRRQAGFTLIEVALALGILTFSAVGIMALQTAAIRGNISGRTVSTATEINRRWLERVRRDTALWTDPSAAGRANTLYLNGDVAPAPGNSGWFLPANAAAPLGELASAGWSGEDDAAGTTHYCTHLRVSWIVDDTAARVDVRTFFPRAGIASGDGASDRSLFECEAGTEAVMDDLIRTDPAQRIQAVGASVVVRWTPPTQ